MARLTDCIADYLSFIQHEQKVARSTYLCYASWMHHFQRWLDEHGYGKEPDLDVFNTATLRRYLYYLSGERNHRPRTLRGAFLPLKGMGRFLVTNKALAEDPTAPLVMPKKDAARRLLLSDTDIRALIDGSQRQRNPRLVAQARAVVLLLVYGGLRAGELLDLRPEDVTVEKDTESPQGKTRIFVRCGKGSKSRTIYGPLLCFQAVRDWLTFRPTDCQHDRLFHTDRVRPMQRRGFDTLWKSIVAAAGLKENQAALPHACRHWRACDLLKSGADLKSIQSFLGHATLGTTAIYLHIDEERTRDLAHLSQLREPVADNVTDLHTRQRTPVSEQRRQRRRIAR